MASVQRNRQPQARAAAAGYSQHAIHSEPDWQGSEAEVSSVLLETEEAEEMAGWPQAEEPWPEADASMTSMRRKKATPQPKSRGQSSSAKETEEPPPLSKVSTKSKSKAEQRAATTGVLADFPLLGMTKSLDPPMNASWVFHQRVITHKWKTFLLMMRMEEAMVLSRLHWKRNPAWLARLYATELAAMWGHFGSCVKTLRQPKGAIIFR